MHFVSLNCSKTVVMTIYVGSPKRYTNCLERRAYTNLISIGIHKSAVLLQELTVCTAKYASDGKRSRYSTAQLTARETVEEQLYISMRCVLLLMLAGAFKGGSDPF